MFTLDQIRALHIELTTQCNARCPKCMRNFHGADVNFGYPNTQLSLPQIQQILPKDFLSQITQVRFNGNVGDFSLARDALDIVQYFLDNSPAKIYVETNGSTRTPDWWVQLNHSRVDVFFALDGLEDVHHLYRQDTDWHKIVANARALIAAGGNAYWKMIPFLHNRHQIDQCRRLARDWGFRDFCLWGQGRDRGPVFNRDGSFSHWLGEPEGPTEIIQNRLNSHYRSIEKSIRIMPDANNKIHCKHLKDAEIYLAADGSVYPCCFMGFFPKTMEIPDNANIRKLIQQNNALEHGLETALLWFSNVYDSWTGVNGHMPTHTCVRVCGQTVTVE